FQTLDISGRTKFGQLALLASPRNAAFRQKGFFLMTGVLDSDLAISQVNFGANLLIARPLSELEQMELSSCDAHQPIEKRRFYTPLKRFFDIVGGLSGLLVLSPIILVVAAITKLIDRGPILYRHSRVGLHGREFTCYKFRTMVPNADEMMPNVLHMNHHD